ncbi:hypothetical protein [Mucilaginibacter sp. R-33]|uniref:hypothetical protein n=1 Tax=Mucilaginibacter sp. R-33 TaxID=3416711 RepID=UPI003CF0D9BC
MKKLILLIPFSVILYSCTPASKGDISQDEKGCTILKNTSTSEKITFVLQYGSVDYKFETRVGPQEESVLGCSEDSKTLHIVGAYVK